MRLKTKLASAVFGLAVPALAFASPTLSVMRTPTGATVSDAYSVTWNSSWAAKIGYRCSGAWNGIQDDISAAWLPLNGTVTGKYEDSMVWTTNCVWTATAQDGSTSTATESFTISRKSAEVFGDFKITKIGGIPYSGSAVSLPEWSKSFTIEGIGAPDARIVLSSAGCVFANEGAKSDGTWSVGIASLSNCKLPDSGAFQFTLSASKAYYGEAVRYATVNFPSSSAVELGKMQCRSGSNYTETNFSSPRGESVTCTVNSNDSKTKLMMDSGYVSWGDVATTKAVEPKTVTEVSTSCSGGSCSATFVSDYAGYSKNRSVWFQNSSWTKSSSISYHSYDRSSADYAQAEAYLNDRYKSSGTAWTATTTGQSSGTSNGTVSVTSVTGGKFSNGKITVTDGQFFSIVGNAPKKAQMRLYRKNMEAEGISTGADDSGKWTMFNLGTKWYSWVFKTGSNQYVVEATSADGKTTTSATVEIEIVAQSSGTATSSQTTQERTSGSAQGPNGTSAGNANSNSAGSSASGNGTSVANAASKTSDVPQALKTKLDAFATVLESNAKSKGNAQASLDYVTKVRSKLSVLEAKYRKAGKKASAAAISYVIGRTDEIAAKFRNPQTEENELMQNLKESY